MEDLYVILMGLLLIITLFTVSSLTSKLEKKEAEAEAELEQLRAEVCTKEAEIEQLRKENRILRTDLQLAREGFSDRL